MIWDAALCVETEATFAVITLLEAHVVVSAAVLPTLHLWELSDVNPVPNTVTERDPVFGRLQPAIALAVVCPREEEGREREIASITNVNAIHLPPAPPLSPLVVCLLFLHREADLSEEEEKLASRILFLLLFLSGTR